ncbi:hypothetical protein AWB71_02547 [Caballeronia peredens]|nr:hypothetical protein AWB71_02547 [Caballeronia peredens]
MNQEFDYTECKRQYHQDILSKTEENRKAGLTIDPNLMAELDEVMNGPGWQALVNGPEPIPEAVYKRYDFVSGSKQTAEAKAEAAKEEAAIAKILMEKSAGWAKERAQKERKAKEHQQRMEDRLASGDSLMDELNKLS